MVEATFYGGNKMIVEHPDRQRTFIMQAGTPMVATVEKSGWVQIGHFCSDGLSIDDDEWNAFIELIVEADRVKRGSRLNLSVEAIVDLSNEAKIIS